MVIDTVFMIVKIKKGVRRFGSVSPTILEKGWFFVPYTTISRSEIGQAMQEWM